MQIKEILTNFGKQLNDIYNEETKNKPIAFQVYWRCEQLNKPIIDMRESYWYFEDDGTIVFRINDTTGTECDYELKTGTFQEFKSNFDEFLKQNGDTEQGKCDSEIENNFFFFTEDYDGLSGSYWLVSDFTFIDDDDKIIIKINDWG